jgi:DNA-binding CsgD family transcriptional regulator
MTIKLTDREKETIDLLAEGLYYKEIAERMSISEGNARQKIHKIYKKLDASNRTEALNKYRDDDKK